MPVEVLKANHEDASSTLKQTSFIRLLLFALASCFGIVGCRPNGGASLSPDARFVAYNGEKLVVVHSLVDRRADRTILLKKPGSPSCSPDGKWLVLPSALGALLLDSKGDSVMKLPPFESPIAWNPDSSEFVGFHNKSAVVIHVATRSIVRTYPLPIIPVEAIWLGPGRNMAFCSDNWIVTICNGQVHSLQLQASEIHLAYDAEKNRVVWAVMRPTPNFYDDPNQPGRPWFNSSSVIQWAFPVPPAKSATWPPPLNPESIGACAPDLKTPMERFSHEYLTSRPYFDLHHVFSWIRSVSPNAKSLIQVQVFDRSPYEELRQLVKIERAVVDATSREEQERLQDQAKMVSKGVSLSAQWSILHLGGDEPVREVILTSNSYDIPMITWSADSRHVAFVLKDRSFVVEAKP